MVERKVDAQTSPNGPLVRSSKEIKAGLLRKAWMTGAAAEIISQIQLRHQRNVTMPEGHKEALFHIVPGQDPALMRINLRNYLSGVSCSFSSVESAPTAPKAGLLEPKKYETHEIFETLLEEQKQTAQKPDSLLAHGPLLLLENADEAKVTGQLYYADDAYLARQPDYENGELNYTLYPNVATPYSDGAYRAKNNGESIYEKIASADANPLDNPAEIMAEDQLTDPKMSEAHSPYIDAFFDATQWPKAAIVADAEIKNESDDCDGDSLYESIFGDAQAGKKTANDTVATTLTHAGKAGAHSPYIDKFFNAARWPEPAFDAKTEIDEEAEAMNRLATVKPAPSLQ